MMKVLDEIANEPGSYLMHCPGCEMYHQIWTQPGRPAQWSFDGNMDKPTFSPSLLVNWGKDNVCHSFIRNGQWQFLGDCTHSLAGKTVDMVDVDE